MYNGTGMSIYDFVYDAVYGNLITDETSTGFVLTIARLMNQDWYQSLPEENQFLEKLRGIKELPFSGRYSFSGEKKMKMKSGEHAFAATFENEKSELGFIDVTISVDADCTLMILNSD